MLRSLTRCARVTSFILYPCPLSLTPYPILSPVKYCQNPNSTNNSIEVNLRLDYILTERSTPPTTNHKLSVVVVVNCPSYARQTILYNYTVSVQCSRCVLRHLTRMSNVNQLKYDRNTLNSVGCS
jgi:hypothetical protein